VPQAQNPKLCGTRQGGETGYAIYVREGAILNEQHRKAYLTQRPDDKKAATDKKLSPQSDDEMNRLRQFMCDNFFDVALLARS